MLSQKGGVMEEYNVGDLVSEFLYQIGVKDVFGVVSVHNIPMLDAIGRRNYIQMIPARGEMGAGHMADGSQELQTALELFLLVLDLVQQI